MAFKYILLVALLANSLSALDKCTNPAATLYDGYLDSSISYVSFDQPSNSYFQIQNPYSGIAPLNTSTVAFWARSPSISLDGT